MFTNFTGSAAAILQHSTYVEYRLNQPKAHITSTSSYRLASGVSACEYILCMYITNSLLPYMKQTHVITINDHNEQLNEIKNKFRIIYIVLLFYQTLRKNYQYTKKDANMISQESTYSGKVKL